MEIICIIPARGGSKGIPNKNIIDFCGKPLLAWSILQARQTRGIKDVYVSSDDDKILKIANDYHAKPVKRPDQISTDTATSESALLHALDVIESEGKKVDIVVFLQATSPLREAKDIDNAIEKLLDEQADSLFSSAKLEDFFIWKDTDQGLISLNYDYQKRLRRQDVKPQYVENGSIYICKPEILKKYCNRLGGHIVTYEMAFWKTWEIDSLDDKVLCEWYFMNRLIKRGVNLMTSTINLIVYDFDGVMTDNRVLTFQDGTEAIFANRSDGLAINMIKEIGITQIIMSTERNDVVAARARKIGIPVIHGVGDKLSALRTYCTEEQIDMRQVLFVGNDINDMEAMKFVGLVAVPADAHPDVKRIASIILKQAGGMGAIRELADLILREREWNA